MIDPKEKADWTEVLNDEEVINGTLVYNMITHDIATQFQNEYPLPDDVILSAMEVFSSIYQKQISQIQAYQCFEDYRAILNAGGEDVDNFEMDWFWKLMVEHGFDEPTIRETFNWMYEVLKND